jgi:hypothetical protein
MAPLNSKNEKIKIKKIAYWPLPINFFGPWLLASFLAIMVIKCDYYSLSAYAVMTILNYYLNLYANLNNAVITKYKLK